MMLKSVIIPCACKPNGTDSGETWGIIIENPVAKFRIKSWVENSTQTDAT